MGKISKKEEAVENTIKKPTYEELEQFCNQLSVQNKFFRELIQKAFDENLHKIMGHLFQVITLNKENPNRFSNQFVKDTFSKIEELLSPFLEKEPTTETSDQDIEKK